MACEIDWSFLTDDCRPDNGKLRTALEELNATVCQEIIPLDPNFGACGEWGIDSTIDSVTYDGTTKELAISAQPGWTSALINQITTTNFAPLNITALGTYVGSTVNINFNNPSQCRQCLVYGNFYNSNVFRSGAGKSHTLEVRDITLGLPGLLVGDTNRLIVGGDLTDETVHTIPFVLLLPAGGNFTASYRSTIVTTVTAGGTTSLWYQNILHIVAMGTLI